MGIDTKIDRLPDPVQIHVVAAFSNAYRSIFANLTDEMLPMDVS